MNQSKIRTHVDFKVDALGKLSNLLLNNNHGERRVNILTAFGSIQGNVASNTSSNEDVFNLKSLMDDVIVDEYISYLGAEHPEKTFNYNFVVLDNVIVRPFASFGTEIEYKQLIVYAEQITSFNFM
ncbi:MULTISPECIES: hypothetical protein [Paenibacillus]|uniref:Uncharacterized protein n=1 Tax=Paenibacillus helianthi TaxID=1349432 RepID=A0ABX3EJW2_9BACL|nr:MULTISPECIES: hypothetical protein [Paenibacillus]OKP84699.1 hypothetical protein A3844_18900 [Paenibacillus helianthi]OKP91543.1 hypothetical protein A3842_02685 [Paenibacillus sp. P3E]OKP92484.1 hypothetical protein A3848_08475 [Paenibacillus sp. P32E]OKP96504.1 hypothetical protein A3849_20650 [Paenibacillus sp. P46E]